MNQTEAIALAVSLKDQHGLYAWKVELDRSKRRFGYCSQGERTISISKYWGELLVQQNVYARLRMLALVLF